jgi:hypothetical protein
MLLAAVVVAELAVALPPPLCRGRQYTQYDPRQDASPSPRAVAEIQAAYDALCPNKKCGTGEIYKNPTVGNNALTWVSGIRDGENTKAKIVYSAEFLDGLAASYGDGASFGVLAHEVGHHLTAALSKRTPFDKSWDEELRADYLAGCALGRAGRSPVELDAALKALAAVATPTHPSFQSRVPVVHKGYDSCRKVQDGLDQKASGSGFGIGAAIREAEGKTGCWAYFFRTGEAVAHLGPVAAPRKRSDGYSTKEACERSRSRALEGKAVAEPCACAAP